jgi:hypothetical protein
MKKYSILFCLFLQLAMAFAQAPEKMSYQAVVRNNNNVLVSNHAVGMRISILQASATGTAVYTETQTPTTNANGLIAIEIGTGTVVTGSFANIDWANGPYFVKTETDPNGGTAYTLSASNQLLSVPYALYAKTAGNGSSLPSGGTYGQTLYKCNGNIQWGPCLPLVQTNQVSSISNDSTNIDAIVLKSGGAPILESGIVWSTSSAPTINNNKLVNTNQNVSFSLSITGLSANTTYYVRAYAINEAGINYGNELSFTSAKFQLRQLFAGGIIFYLDSTKEHGLVCANASIGSYEWGCSNSNVGWGTSINFGSGLSNTQNIMAACSGSNVAAKVARGITLNGYTNWYLPSVGELLMIKQNVSNFNVGPTGVFWSSSEDNQVYAKRVALYNSTTNNPNSYDTKYTANPVLPIRAF